MVLVVFCGVWWCSVVCDGIGGVQWCVVMRGGGSDSV